MNDNNGNKQTFAKFKAKILTSPHWIVSLDENDIRSFQGNDDGQIIILESSTENSTDQRLQILFDCIAEQYKVLSLPCCKCIRLLIHIQFPISVPLMMSEMNIINDMVDMIIPPDIDCEVKWGLAPREDGMCKITCAISHMRNE